MRNTPNIKFTTALLGIIAATVTASVLVTTGVTSIEHSTTPSKTSQSASTTGTANLAAYVSNHSISVRVPGSNRVVSAIDPRTFNSHINPQTSQAVISAEASSSATLSTSDYQQAQNAFALALAQTPIASVQITGDTRTASSLSVELAATHKITITMYRWELEALAWYLIVGGTAVGVIGGFFDLSGVGIPLGAILNAAGAAQGLGGWALLSWAGSHFPVSKTVTIRW